MEMLADSASKDSSPAHALQPQRLLHLIELQYADDDAVSSSMPLASHPQP